MSELTVEGVFTTLAVTAVRAKAIRAAGKKSSDRRCEVPARPLQWGDVSGSAALAARLGTPAWIQATYDDR